MKRQQISANVDFFKDWLFFSCNHSFIGQSTTFPHHKYTLSLQSFSLCYFITIVIKLSVQLDIYHNIELSEKGAVPEERVEKRCKQYPYIFMVMFRQLKALTSCSRGYVKFSILNQRKPMMWISNLNHHRPGFLSCILRVQNKIQRLK